MKVGRIEILLYPGVGGAEEQLRLLATTSWSGGGGALSTLAPFPFGAVTIESTKLKWSIRGSASIMKAVTDWRIFWHQAEKHLRSRRIGSRQICKRGDQ